MSAKQVSPTASLLRASRLFSLPPPLSRPNHDLTSTSSYASDSATLPYPTHVAIATPQSSLSRGDWGLKRSLPLQSTTNTSTPTIRIQAIDSLEHITNFDSAADHVLTLRKWQEMNIPVLQSPPETRTVSRLWRDSNRVDRSPRWSVFEQNFDNTHRKEEESRANAGKRWKYRGPWLAGKTEEQFNQYVNLVISKRKRRFRNHLRQQLIRLKEDEQRALARDEGRSDEELEPINISNEDFSFYLKSLRRDPPNLNKLIHEFLDLPASPTEKGSYSQALGGRSETNSASAAVYAESGPPNMHPSAGLSYLRTSSYIPNHPVLGPQASTPPVKARVLRARGSTTGYETSAIIGIGGVVGHDSRPRSFKDSSGKTLSEFDPTIPGGAKVWVRPDRASIDTQGKIKIKTLHADQIAIQIQEGKLVREEKPFTVPDIGTPSSRMMPSFSPPKRSPATSSKYGMGSYKADLEADSSDS